MATEAPPEEETPSHPPEAPAPEVCPTCYEPTDTDGPYWVCTDPGCGGMGGPDRLARRPKRRRG